MTDEVQLKFRYFCKVYCLLHLSNPTRHEYGEEMEKGPGEIERTSCSVKKLLLIDEFTNPTKQVPYKNDITIHETSKYAHIGSHSTYVKL